MKTSETKIVQSSNNYLKDLSNWVKKNKASAIAIPALVMALTFWGCNVKKNINKNKWINTEQTLWKKKSSDSWILDLNKTKDWDNWSNTWNNNPDENSWVDNKNASNGNGNGKSGSGSCENPVGTWSGGSTKNSESLQKSEEAKYNDLLPEERWVYWF